MFRRLDQLLTTIARRPGPAIAALCVGVLVGFTIAAAFGGSKTSQTDQRRASDAQRVLPAVATPPQGSTRKKAPRNAPQTTETVPPAQASSGNLQDAVDAAASAAGGQGSVGVAAIKLSGGQVYTAGESRSFEAWSTSKIPAIALYLKFHTTPDAAAVSHIERAITQSSNVDVRALYGQLVHEHGVRGANAELRSLVASNGGPFENLEDRRDPSIDNSVPVGNARWSPATAVQFFQRLADGCVLPSNPDGARRMLTYMNSLTEGNWGAPQVFPPDRVFAKSGWAETGSTVSQIAIVGRGQDAYVVAIMTEPGNYPLGQHLIARMLESFKRVAGTPKSGGGSLPRTCGAGGDAAAPPAGGTPAPPSGSTGND